MHDPSLYHRFQQAVAVHSGRIAIRDAGIDLTYRELEAASREVGAALIALGMRHGDRIAIWGVNSADWVVAALGIQAAGCVLIPIGTRLRGREAADILIASQARFVFCDRGFGGFSFVDALATQALPAVEHIVVFREAGGSIADRILTLPALRAWPERADEAALDARIAAGSGADLADIIFTSGTTGRPKGVLMTHRQSIIACDVQSAEINKFVPDDVFAVTYPFAHNAGYRAGWQVSLFYGVRIIPVSSFDAGELLRMIEREGVTVLPTAPPIARGLLDHPDRAETDLSSLRLMSTGGTTIPVRLVEEMRTHLGPNTIVQTGYGLTEAAGSVTTTGFDDGPEIVAKTVGHVLSNLEMRIVGPDHAELSIGETGEIAVRGPQVTPGYLDNPEATARAFTEDGFLLTGDAGWIDEAGNLHITDRIKDMYLVGGFNCYPAEIERMMGLMPGIAAVAVIGVDDDRLGQVGRAFVVTAEDASLTENDVISWCRAEMANYKVPRSVRFVEALPLNATGKVAKVELRALS
ncbi:MAG: AMP-binding protein [Sphingomonadaceae bacterium]|nr:AMP-binding protein [Sphingomonadaceae bacterium]